MEQNPENIIITIPSPPLDDEPKPTPIRSRKRSNGLHALKAALFTVRGRSRKSSALPVDDGSNSVWRKLVGSMRPLHLQSNQSPRSDSQPDGQPFEQPEQVSLPPSSPSSGYKSDFLSEEEPYSPSPPSSRYASAVGLNELVQSDEDNEKPDVIVEDCNEQHGEDGDVMIDAKAEEFIAQFYQEMRLQRMNSADRCYQERSHRSLGW